MGDGELEKNSPVWQQIKEDGGFGGRKVHIFDSVPSTNTLALKYGREGAESGTVVAAETQSSGRGRLGKDWHSPAASGLYFSIILRPRLQIQDLAKVTLAAGLAVCKALEEVSGVSAKIKWPNDILVDGRKLAGILTESDSLRGGEVPFVVVGIGLNVNTQLDTLPEELRHKAVSLLGVNDRWHDKGVILKAILLQVDLEIGRLEQGDFAEILTEWRGKDATIGQVLTWLTVDGKVISGECLGPDDEGILIIRDERKKTHRILSGDVSLGRN